MVDFDRALDDKVRAGDGTLEVAVRELERDMGVMRKVLGVLESGSAWAWSKVGRTTTVPPSPVAK